LRPEENVGAFVPANKGALPQIEYTPKALNTNSSEPVTPKASQKSESEKLDAAHVWEISQTKKSPRKSKVNQPAYKYRNVYKSVVRHLYVYTQDNKDKLLNILKVKGFREEEIRAALEVIKGYKSEETPKEIEKGAKFRIERMLRKKTIYIYILRETLEHMIVKWKNERYGQLYKVNSSIYIEACSRFLRRAEELINNY
jgi:hypothetical protein